MNRRQMRKAKKNKTAAIKAHFKTRMSERFGFEITQQEIDQIISAIQKQKPTAHFVKKQSHSRTVYMMAVRGKKIRIVYDKLRHQPVTAIPIMCKSCGEKPAECMGDLCYSCDHMEGDIE